MPEKTEYFPGTNEKILRKVIITSAVTGAVHFPSQSDYLPLTPKQIIDDAVASARAGAAMVHIHARNPENGEPSFDLKVFREILTGVKQQCDAIVCITTGGAGNAEQRIAVVPEFKPEIATLNCGSLNTGAMAMRQAGRPPKFKYQWEEDRFKKSGTGIFQNTYQQQLDYATIDKANDTKPELEIWDMGHLRGAWALCENGVVDRPPRIQFVVGSYSGMPATPHSLLCILEETRKMIGDFTYSVAAVGRDQLPMAAFTLLLGGDVRVGMEDSVYCGYGRMATSSSEQVERVVKMARELSIAPATPAEARQMMGLKGDDKVNW